MDGDIFFKNLIAAFLLPPLNLILLGVMGYLLGKKWPKVGMTTSIASLLMLIFISTPFGALLLIRPLEKMSIPLTSTHNTKAQAIVVLGGGRLKHAPEYGGQHVPNALTLIRLRYAAKLHNESGLPVLVSGGAPDGAGKSEALQMARVLREDFSVPVKWLEENSNDTAQNAQFSARILQKVGVQRIVLVTDAMHMPRSQRIFEKNGFNVVPAPTQFYSHEPVLSFNFVPNAYSLYRASFAMHEWIGLVWYRLRY